MPVRRAVEEGVERSGVFAPPRQGFSRCHHVHPCGEIGAFEKRGGGQDDCGGAHDERLGVRMLCGPRSGSDDGSSDGDDRPGRAGQRARGTCHRRRCLSLLLLARDHGSDAQANGQRPGRQVARLRSCEYLPEHPGLSRGRRPSGRAPQLRHAVFERVARSHQGARHRLRAGHGRALLPPADARHVDRCVRLPGLAHHGNAGPGVPDCAAGMAARSEGKARRGVQAPEGNSAHRCADAARLDHRPHKDGRPGRLCRGQQDPGGIEDHGRCRNGAGRREQSRSRPIRPSI